LIRIGIRINGGRIVVPDAADDPPPSGSTGVVSVKPATAAPACEVMVVETVNFPMPALVPHTLEAAVMVAIISRRRTSRDRHRDQYSNCT
jgi:hypothetical protein